jgi:microcystin-dependent protein
MSNYVKATNFTAKDALPTGDSGKIVKGTEIDVELSAIAAAIASKSDSNSPTFTGTPLAPTASAGTNNTQLATTAFVSTAVAASFPTGGIILWSGSVASIPSGWALCNGSNGTPDLRNRFVVGAGSTYAVAATGGSADAIVVAHTHTATSTVSDPGHVHTANSGGLSGGAAAAGGDAGFNRHTAGGLTTNSNTTGISVSTTVASAGSSGTNANLPPYYALAYIMKL